RRGRVGAACARGAHPAWSCGRSTSPLDAMKPFPEDHELVGFFEAEPKLTDRDVPWFYNRLTFATVRGHDRIVCDIEPGYGELVVSWDRSGKSVGRFSLSEVASLHVTSTGGEEFLVAKFRRNGLLDFKLYLKPYVQIEWGNEQVV